MTKRHTYFHPNASKLFHKVLLIKLTDAHESRRIVDCTVRTEWIPLRNRIMGTSGCQRMWQNYNSVPVS